MSDTTSVEGSRGTASALWILFWRGGRTGQTSARPPKAGFSKYRGGVPTALRGSHRCPKDQRPRPCSCRLGDRVRWASPPPRGQPAQTTPFARGREARIPAPSRCSAGPAAAHRLQLVLTCRGAASFDAVYAELCINGRDGGAPPCPLQTPRPERPPRIRRLPRSSGDARFHARPRRARPRPRSPARQPRARHLDTSDRRASGSSSSRSPRSTTPRSSSMRTKRTTTREATVSISSSVGGEIAWNRSPASSPARR
jgi:hypothetical protein